MSNFVTKPCPSCNTRGTIECRSCRGSGKVLNPKKTYAYSNNEPTLIICNICVGTGRIMCNVCMGNGSIVIQN